MEKAISKPVISEKDTGSLPSKRSLSPLEEFDRMIEGFFERSWMKPFFKEDLIKERLGFFGQHNPKVDIIDRDTEIEVRAELPGIDRKEIDLEITEHAVMLKGQRSGKTEEKQDEYYHQKFGKVPFLGRLPCQ